jgi:hypothetical protein
MSDFDMSKLTREEREILIRKTDEDDDFDVITTSKVWKERFERAGWEMKKDHQGGWSCRIPENAITIRREKAVNLSPEERAKRAANLAGRPNSGGKPG